MITTENYSLRKQTQDDFYDIDIYNENIEVVDSALGEIAQKQNNVKHYNAFSEVDKTFDATTPIVTLFQAMAPNSILNCVVNQANSVYPSAQGSLNLTKMTETEGSVQFLSSDGKLSTGAFTQAV